MKAEYVTSAKTAAGLPEPSLPEIAFVGRSNCGKSSLINALTNRKDLARKSQTPGRTQMANFFSVNDRFMFVDLPGYGFSKTGMKSRGDWQELMDAYLSRPEIKHFVFIFDVRRKLNSEDLDVIAYLRNKGDVLGVATKTDKASKSELNKLKQQFADIFPGDLLKTVSNTKKTGIDALRDHLLA